MSYTRLHRLYEEQEQAPWLDNISRNMITSGELQRMIDDGIVGVTSNPTIFEKALASGSDYDEQMQELVASGLNTRDLFFGLMIQDIGKAADLFRGIWEQTKHLDGYISIEVTPDLAKDTEATMEQARAFKKELGRPNILVKVPATREGIPAIEQLIYEGININVTLIFSLDRYQEVMNAYLRGLERRQEEGKPIDDIWSVASFFVSRVDTNVDKRLQKLIDEANSEEEKKKLKRLMGKAAVANAKLAYQLFLENFSGPRWEKLAADGAKYQRPLWASTGTKNPEYSDILYVDSLIGPHTVNTMPNQTIVAFNDHGKIERTIDKDVDQARQVIEELAAVGIHMDDVTQQLEDEGVASFAKSYESLSDSLVAKVEALRQGQQQNEGTSLGKHFGRVSQSLVNIEQTAGTRPIWEKDGAWWSDDPAERLSIENRLGWVPVVKQMIAEADELAAFAEDISKAGFENVLVMGMGGSSLAPDLLSSEFETRPGYPEVYVLDSTDPAVIALIRGSLDPKNTLYVVSSKSGTTTEPLAFFHYFWDMVQKKKGDKAGQSFVAITDPDTELGRLAAQHNFRRIFENPPDIGGRYSALSYFGLVPAALMGIDIRKLLPSALEMMQRCEPGVPAQDNPGAWLGGVLGTLGKEGIDKVTIITSPGLLTFGDWAEQLIAESTGKKGTGLVPVTGEEVGPPEIYGDDRLFVYLRLEGDDNDDLDAAVGRLIDAELPVIIYPLKDIHEIGGEFFRWEVATAVAGKILGVNPFDEPNVSESKNNTKRLLDEYAQKGRLPEHEPDADAGAIELYISGDLESASGDVEGYLSAFFDQIGPGDYFAILAYLDAAEENEAALQEIRTQVRDAYRVATTLGFGPRYLHSTGQLHKGGPNKGVFLLITADPAGDVKIPGLGYSFATLIRAQALGDLQALRDKNRRVIWLHLTNAEDGLEELRSTVEDALSQQALVG